MYNRSQRFNGLGRPGLRVTYDGRVASAPASPGTLRNANECVSPLASAPSSPLRPTLAQPQQQPSNTVGNGHLSSTTGQDHAPAAVCVTMSSTGQLGALGSTAARGDNVFYARDGFGQTYYQDHTQEGRRGSWWVGTAPGRKESVSRTSYAMPAGELEFTRKCAVEGE